MKPIDKFGKFFIENIRDKSIDYLEFMFDGRWNAPELQPLQAKVLSLTPELKATVRELVERLLSGAMRDILFAFQESHDCNEGIEIMVHGKPIAWLSDGLHGEIFGKDGWIVRFSKFPSEIELAGSRWAEDMIKEMFPDDDSNDDAQ